MSAFYDLASLVLVPSGYKASKVYAQKPLTTDGQLTFSRASTATRVNSAGLIETVASNVPRLDYLGSTCPKLLLEPQRSNSLTYSEQFNNAAWTTNNSTISANVTATLDPSGYNGADKLQETATTADHNVGSETITALSGEVVTFSVFLKAAERTWAAIRLYDGNGSKFAYFNLSTGVVGSVTAGATSAISSYGNGWYRCAITTTMASNTITLPFVSTATADGTRNFAGTAGSGIYCFGAQQELGAYATSYIPTTTAAVTRLADAASKTGISSLIGQTEGTIFLEMAPIGSTTSYTERVLKITGGTDEIGIYRYGDNILYVAAASGGSLSFSFEISNIFTAGQVEKIAIAYKLNDVALYLNGVLIGTDTSAAMFTSLANLFFANDASASLMAPQNVNQALLFKTRLTNAQLAEITTL